MAKTSNEHDLAEGQMTLNELRGILSDEIRNVRSGQSTAATVNAVTNASGKILSSVKLEMEYYKMLGQTPNIAALLPAVKESAAKA